VHTQQSINVSPCHPTRGSGRRNLRRGPGLGPWLVFLLALPCAGAENFEFEVRHHHLFRDCLGTLRITGEGVEYRTDHSKDSRRWSFSEIQTIEVRSGREIAIRSYEDQKRFAGKDRTFEFRLVAGEATPELTAFLLERVHRPMVLAVVPSSGKAVFEIPVKHLKPVSGAMGTLRIFPDRVVFESQRDGDSRIWRFSDIQRFSQPGRFRFQIVSHVPRAGGPTETYNFQLREDLPAGVYDYLWARLHPSTYYPDPDMNRDGFGSAESWAGPRVP